MLKKIITSIPVDQNKRVIFPWSVINIPSRNDGGLSSRTTTKYLVLNHAAFYDEDSFMDDVETQSILLPEDGVYYTTAELKKSYIEESENPAFVDYENPITLGEFDKEGRVIYKGHNIIDADGDESLIQALTLVAIPFTEEVQECLQDYYDEVTDNGDLFLWEELAEEDYENIFPEDILEEMILVNIETTEELYVVGKFKEDSEDEHCGCSCSCEDDSGDSETYEDDEVDSYWVEIDSEEEEVDDVPNNKAIYNESRDFSDSYYKPPYEIARFPGINGNYLSVIHYVPKVSWPENDSTIEFKYCTSKGVITAVSYFLSSFQEINTISKLTKEVLGTMCEALKNWTVQIDKLTLMELVNHLKGNSVKASTVYLGKVLNKFIEEDDSTEFTLYSIQEKGKVAYVLNSLN